MSANATAEPEKAVKPVKAEKPAKKAKAKKNKAKVKAKPATKASGKKAKKIKKAKAFKHPPRSKRVDVPCCINFPRPLLEKNDRDRGVSKKDPRGKVSRQRLLNVLLERYGPKVSRELAREKKAS